MVSQKLWKALSNDLKQSYILTCSPLLSYCICGQKCKGIQTGSVKTEIQPRYPPISQTFWQPSCFCFGANLGYGACGQPRNLPQVVPCGLGFTKSRQATFAPSALASYKSTLSNVTNTSSGIKIQFPPIKQEGINLHYADRGNFHFRQAIPSLLHCGPNHLEWPFLP